ncbi:heme lyase CcmF/NrfE family subunit [Alginatibacterium sediminis]|uniref:Heme lyase CcmF/NrfE family subunit n=1 Tax=Alginatibacterium sediminis TaxID=2164068 RepID=A0A420EFR6_9ALTE|nr:heme lyase CcmF/NrfE family subunit [Alginatibacterium sediminis]RKF19510.1 heme lyase CcmF/NrfE family subunit [Alginatibacterium sediminis]
MIIELGHYALILATALAVIQSIYPLIGAQTGNLKLMRMARPLALSQFLFVLFSFVVLSYAFYNNDFSVAYVANNSNSFLPWYFRLSAVWGAHEGSLLLWALILAGWAGAVAIFSRGLPIDAVARVLAVMGMICIGFYLFILLTSNPFDRILPIFPIDGRDLNPLLQDFGLIVHPPLLYMGYVGFSVAFAFAIAALIAGRLDSTWARWSRPWTTAAWVFLTVGIALGSWWAYYELGWGGWWFWDPVENASFMPWLVGTALLHSLAVTEKRGVFKSWTVLLAISAFSLSLLGTFLVRSGVLVSVHAFASDPARGLFILGFLLAVIGGSLLLFAVRASQVKSRGRYEFWSRETFLLINNVLLIAALLVVLLGTLLPLVHKEIGLGSISIGEAFFNRMFSWLIVPFGIAMGVGPLLRWKREKFDSLKKPLIILAVVSIALPSLCLLLLAPEYYLLANVALALATWIISCSCYEVYLRATHRHSLVKGLSHLGRSHWAMVLGHIGLAVSIIGIAVTSHYSIERDVRMQAGESVQFADYRFHFTQVVPIQGPNYSGHQGILDVYQGEKQVATLQPEKRVYRVQRSMMTEAAIDAGLWRDLYSALGEELPGDAWALRIYYKPFIRWIWLGSIIMGFAGLLAVSDRRYRMAIKKQPDANAKSTEATT